MRRSTLWITLGLALCLGGCGEDDPAPSGNASATPTATTGIVPTATAVPAVPTPVGSATGPQITFLGVTRADDVLVEPTATSPTGVPIFSRLAGAAGGASGFRLVVEAKPGVSGRAVGVSTYSSTGLPDLQIQANRPLGNGSAAVCDVARPTPGPGIPPPGGVPAITSPSFEATSANVDILNDLGCRFRDGAGDTRGISTPDDGCVKIEPTEDYGFVKDETTVQFCGFVSAILTFPTGDTLLTVQVRDEAGGIGPAKQMIVRVD